MDHQRGERQRGLAGARRRGDRHDRADREAGDLVVAPVADADRHPLQIGHLGQARDELGRAVADWWRRGRRCVDDLEPRRIRIARGERVDRRLRLCGVRRVDVWHRLAQPDDVGRGRVAQEVAAGDRGPRGPVDLVAQVSLRPQRQAPWIELGRQQVVGVAGVEVETADQRHCGGEGRVVPPLATDRRRHLREVGTGALGDAPAVVRAGPRSWRGRNRIGAPHAR